MCWAMNREFRADPNGGVDRARGAPDRDGTVGSTGTGTGVIREPHDAGVTGWDGRPAAGGVDA